MTPQHIARVSRYHRCALISQTRDTIDIACVCCVNLYTNKYIQAKAVYGVFVKRISIYNDW